MEELQPPFPYLRLAALTEDGDPILESGEGAVEWMGRWYIIDDQITLQ